MSRAEGLPGGRQRRTSRALWWCLFLPACASTQFDGHVFRNDELSFRVAEVPPEWRRVEAQGPLLVFRNDNTESSVAINGRCGKDGDDVPLVALTHHLFLNFTERDVESQEAFTLDGREALHTQMTAKLDGVPKDFDIVVLKKNGCVYDFLHVQAPDSDTAGSARFMAFVRGFSTIAP